MKPGLIERICGESVPGVDQEPNKFVTRKVPVNTISGTGFCREVNWITWSVEIHHRAWGLEVEPAIIDVNASVEVDDGGETTRDVDVSAATGFKFAIKSDSGPEYGFVVAPRAVDIDMKKKIITVYF